MAVTEFLSFDEAVLRTSGLRLATRAAAEKALVELAPLLEKKLKSELGKTIGAVNPKFGWPPLTAQTIKQKAALKLGKGGDPRTMLYATGEFYHSIKVVVDPKSLAIHLGSTSQHAVYTEFGTVNQPARPVFRPVSKKVIDDFKPIFEAAVAEEYGSLLAGSRRSWYRYQIAWLGIEDELVGSRAPQVGTKRYSKLGY